MPEKQFKVDIYDVRLPVIGNNGVAQGVPFIDAINNARIEPLPNRYKFVNGKGRRLEDHTQEHQCFLLNFLTFEFSGPGRSETTTPAVPNNLNSDEYFTVETSMLYDPQTQVAFVESSFSGMRYGALACYFREFSYPRTEYLMYPRMDDDAAARARRFQSIRGFTMHVRAGAITGADHRAGVDSFKVVSEELGAGVFKLEFRSGRRRDDSLIPDRVWQVVDAITESNNASVSKLELYGREHDDEPLEPIDLIQHRERYARNLPVNDVTRAIPYRLRWTALLEIRQEFLP